MPVYTPRRHTRSAPAAALAPGLLLALVFASTGAAPAAAQAPLRTPNLPGPWVGAPGVLHLDLQYRFDDDDVGLTALSAAWGIGGYALAQVTRVGGEAAGADVDEWELAVRFSPFTSLAGAPADLGISAAYNEEHDSFDGELVVGVPALDRRLHLLGALRLLGDAYGGEDSRWFVGTGVLLRLHERLSLTADLVRPADVLEDEATAWGTAARLLVPGTPATLSLEATNTRAPTFHASSQRSGGTRWGVRVHVPVPLRRLLGGAEEGPSPDRAGRVDLVADDTARVAMVDAGFEPATVTVRPGTWVRWTNASGGIHSVVADDGTWESPLMAPDESFGRVFTGAGEHGYACRLHPEETGTVVVGAGGAPPAG